jgi:hypothetical protein
MLTTSYHYSNNMFKRIALATGALLLFTTPSLSSITSDRLREALELTPVTPVVTAVEEVVQELEAIPVEPEPQRWVGKNFTQTEQEVLDFLQEMGIDDRAALATILGNIKQESRFDTKICEGGRRTGYDGCHRGGFGLIQWTTYQRYMGLGRYAKRNGLCPNSLEAQLGWMVNEREWKKIEYVWKTPGKSINGYMWAAKKWLGWGIHGKRTSYAHAYYSALSLA